MNNFSKEKSLAYNLFYSWIDLWGLTSDYNEWNYNCLEDNLPRLIRFQKIQALCKALRIDWNPEGFPKGEFIQERLEKYIDYDPRIFYDLISMSSAESSFSYEYLPDIFEKLYSFRMKLQKALSFNSELLCIGVQTKYSYYITSDLIKSICLIIAPLDKLLISLIDPIGYKYTEEELIRYFDFPIYNMEKIDIDFM